MDERRGSQTYKSERVMEMEGAGDEWGEEGEQAKGSAKASLRQPSPSEDGDFKLTSKDLLEGKRFAAMNL